MTSVLVNGLRRGPGEEAYRALVGHTFTCPTCRAGAPCIAEVRLGREWKKARCS
ncbi:hypothetical protein AB0N93_15330 [Streptomyces sp. NPDC091267]|uniref:hypothetical protein n=1 Tax=Streptomyces sp. NPDC091267 TaxID=3155195 RepID=UPI00343D8A8F